MMIITTEDIFTILGNTAIFGLSIFLAYIVKFQKNKKVYYPWSFYVLNLLPLARIIYKMVYKRIFDAKSILYGFLILVEAIVTFFLMRKLLAPFMEDIDNQDRIWQERIKMQKALDAPLVEKMKYARAMERKARYGLRLRKTSKELKKEADEAKMTVAEYREWCKKTIEQYEIMVRDYNLKHSEPWEY